MPQPTMVLMSALAGPGSADDYARAAQLPSSHNGVPARYVWLEAAHVGTFKATNGRTVMLKAVDLDDLARAHGKLMDSGVNVPVVRNGRERADDVLGYVLHLERYGDSLFALAMLLGDDAAAEARQCRFGAGIDGDFLDSRGVRYGRAVRHLAARPATSAELSAAEAWWAGGGLPRNPLLDVARQVNPPVGAVTLSAAVPSGGGSHSIDNPLLNVANQTRPPPSRVSLSAGGEYGGEHNPLLEIARQLAARTASTSPASHITKMSRGGERDAAEFFEPL